MYNEKKTRLPTCSSKPIEVDFFYTLFPYNLNIFQNELKHVSYTFSSREYSISGNERLNKVLKAGVNILGNSPSVDSLEEDGDYLILDKMNQGVTNYNAYIYYVFNPALIGYSDESEEIGFVGCMRRAELERIGRKCGIRAPVSRSARFKITLYDKNTPKEEWLSILSKLRELYLSWKIN